MQELTYEDDQNKGVDTSMINTCKKLRQFFNVATDIKKIDLILDRIKTNLSLNYNMEM